MKKAIFPGSFDPPTKGHINTIKRAAALVDHLYVAIGLNTQKSSPFFSIEERLNFLCLLTQSISNVEIIAFDGLLVEQAKQLGVNLIIRSIRNFSDFEYETMQAHMNRQLGEIETLYLPADDSLRQVSSSLIREVAFNGWRLHAFVPAEIEEIVFKRLNSIN